MQRSFWPETDQFIVSFDVPVARQGSFQRRLNRIKRFYHIIRVLQSVCECIGLSAALAVYNTAIAYGGRARVYLAQKTRESPNWTDYEKDKTSKKYDVDLQHGVDYWESTNDAPLVKLTYDRQFPRLALEERR